MPYMIIDTETSALMDYARSAEADGQPRVAEFAGVTLNDDLGITGTFQCYVQRDGWSMSPGATAINGITDDMLDKNGVPIKQALDWYSFNILNGYDVIAYNAQFDLKMMRAELARAGRDKLFLETKNACMMRDAQSFSKHVGRHITRFGKRKDGTPVSQSAWPRLTDLCTYLNVPYPKRHSALDDALVTRECLIEMMHLGYRPDPRVHESKNLEAIRSAS